MSSPGYAKFTSTTPELRNLTADATYNIRVRSITDDGKLDLSEWSGIVTAKTSALVTAPVNDPLKVSSFNLKCSNCYDSDATADQLPWTGRRDTVVAQIKAEMPDVIGFQENAQAWLRDENGVLINLAQFEDLQQRLVAAGTNYQVTDSSRYNCEDDRSATNCVYKDQGASHGTKVYYNADTIEMIDQGSERLPFIADEPIDHGRYATWGSFRQKSSGKSFFFVDTHLEPEPDGEYPALRIRQAERIVALIKEKNTANLPVFIVGDLNSNKYTTTANGPYDAFVNAGYVDPIGNDYDSTYPSGKATAESSINAEYNTYNGFNRALKWNVNAGHTSNGMHLDYILTSPMRVAEWKQVLNKEGDSLVGIIPADHNLLTSTVELPASASPLAAKAVQLNGSFGAITGSEVYTKTGGYQRYEKGYVLWSPASGAHTSSGVIRSAFAASGYETGVLGYPTSDEVTGQLNGGSYQTYQNGAIDWSPTTGAYATYGEIRDRWATMGYSAGALGYPTGNVVAYADGSSYQRFQNGFIVASPATGAHTSMGPIRSRWAATGYETGYLGYPTGEIQTGTTGSYQRYEKGFILYSPATGAYSSMGPIRSVYASTGYEGGRLGYPTSEVKTTSTGISQDYAGGTISISTLGVKTITYK
jgi:endonuclease/exonuclease/phosphatase family metal-dependent hydrolase